MVEAEFLSGSVLVIIFFLRGVEKGDHSIREDQILRHWTNRIMDDFHCANECRATMVVLGEYLALEVVIHDPVRPVA